MAVTAGVHSEDGALVAARLLRDRIVVELLREGRSVLFERDDAIARLRLTSGEQVVLIACPASPSRSLLRSVFNGEIKQAIGEVVHIVAVGGDHQVARQLKRSAPFWQLRTRFGFHHVDAEGRLERVTGRRFGPLGDAVRAASSAPDLDEGFFAPQLVHGQQLHAKEHRLDVMLRRRFPWLTLALAAICVLLFVLGQIWSAGNFTLVLHRMGANSGTDVRAGEVWRVLASMFLHANIEHIAVNMIALAAFGPVLERLLGPQRFLVLYGASGLGAGLASALVGDYGVAVGASGAIWGLMAAGIALALWPRGLLPPLRLARARRTAVAPLAINFFYSFAPGVDKWAHFGGGIVGFALMATGLITLGVEPLWTEGGDAAAARGQRRAPGNLTLASIAVGIALAASVVVALVVGQPWRIADPPVLERVRVADTGVVVSLPDTIARAPAAERKGDLQVFTYGDPRRTPVVVEVIVAVLPRAVAAEELDEFLEHERQELQKMSPAGAQRQGDAKLVTVGARRGAVVNHTLNGFALRTSLVVLGDREVVVRSYVAQDLSPAWFGVQDKIAESVQVQ